MNNETKREVYIGVFFLVLAVVYIIGTVTISTFTPFGNRGLDSRSIPQLIGVLVIILSIAHIAQVIVRERQVKAILNDNQGTTESKEEVCDEDEVACIDSPKGTIIERIDGFVSIKLILSFIYLIIYIAAYQPIGFILSSTFFLIAESFLLVKKEDRKKWRVFIILFSVGASVLIYFIFTKYLTLFLPSGILG